MNNNDDPEPLPSLDDNERTTDPPPGGGADLYSAGTIVRDAPDDILQALKKHEALKPPVPKAPRVPSLKPAVELAPEVEIEAEIEPQDPPTKPPPPRTSQRAPGQAPLPVLDLSNKDKDKSGDVDGSLLVNSPLERSPGDAFGRPMLMALLAACGVLCVVLGAWLGSWVVGVIGVGFLGAYGFLFATNRKKR